MVQWWSESHALYKCWGWRLNYSDKYLYSGYKCPYDGDVKCRNFCYRSYQFCSGYQICYDNETANCSKFI